MKLLSRVQLFAAPWSVAYQAPPSMGFSRQEYWSGLPCPPLGDLSNPGIKPRSSALQAGSLSSEPPGKPSPEHSKGHLPPHGAEDEGPLDMPHFNIRDTISILF